MARSVYTSHERDLSSSQNTGSNIDSILTLVQTLGSINEIKSNIQVQYQKIFHFKNRKGSLCQFVLSRFIFSFSIQLNKTILGSTEAHFHHCEELK